MTEIVEVVYETQVTSNGVDIPAPKEALEALDLPVEQGVVVNLTVFRTSDGQHLGTRDRRLYLSPRRFYWAQRGEEAYPEEPVRVHLRKAVEQD
jgi:hypothetical protein